MSYRNLTQYSQGCPQIPPQSLINANQSSKNKRNPFGKQPGNVIQQISVSNPYGELTHQTQSMTSQQGQGFQVQQNPHQYFVQPPTPSLQPSQQFNRIQNQTSNYPQYIQSGYSYPIYQTKNLAPSMQPNSSDPNTLAQHHMHHSLVQPSHLQQVPPQGPPLQQQIQLIPHQLKQPQDQIIYQAPYSKPTIDYHQIQQPKIGLKQPIEAKPIIQPPLSRSSLQRSQQIINYQQPIILQQQQIQQHQSSIEPAMTLLTSSFVPDYNIPPAGPFDIIGRGKLPTINFVFYD